MATARAFDVRGKTAVVTGGGSGINYCFAKMLLEKGCHVLIADLCLRPEAQRLVDVYTGAPKAMFLRTNVTSWKDLNGMFEVAKEVFGEVDIVCPGAGVYEPPWSSFWYPPGTSGSRDAVEEGRYASLDINITHPIRTTQLAIASFLRSREKEGKAGGEGGGKERGKRVLIVSSIAGQVANLHAPIYNAAKHAMNGFVRSLAALDERLGIRVNGVAPGLIKTPLWTEHPEKLQFVGGQDKWATPEEVAEAMLRCLVDDDLPGGSILEVGKDQTRKVEALNDPGPSGPGHIVSNLVDKYEEVYGLLEEGSWGVAKSKL